MRSLVGFLAGLVALLALAFTVPALWISTHLANEDGYVAFSGTLAEDPELQAAFAAHLSNELVDEGLLPSTLRPAATRALTQVARRTSNAPAFIDAWEETQRSFHRSAFADPPPRVLTVDVGPLASFVVERVTDRLPLTLTVPEDLRVPVVSDARDRQTVERIADSTRLGRAGAVIGLLAFVVCLVAARSASGALIRMGVAAAVVAGGLWILSGPAAQRILDHTAAPSEFARTLHKLLVGRAADSLAAWLVVAAIGGVAAAVVGIAGRVLTAQTD